MKPDDGVGEVSVGAHSGGQSEREVGEGAHDEAADEGGGDRGDNEVFSYAVKAGCVAGVDRVEFTRLVGLDDGSGAVGGGEGGVGAEGYAVGDGTGAAGVGEDGSVDGEDVGHGEKRGGAGAELGGEGGVALGEFEALADSALGDVGVEAS